MVFKEKSFLLVIANNIINKMGDNIINKSKDKVVNKIDSVLKNSNGLTITEIVEKTKLNRSSVRIALAKLDGAEKVFVRKIGMAKVYFLKGGKNEI